MTHTADDQDLGIWQEWGGRGGLRGHQLPDSTGMLSSDSESPVGIGTLGPLLRGTPRAHLTKLGTQRVALARGVPRDIEIHRYFEARQHVANGVVGRDGHGHSLKRTAELAQRAQQRGPIR